MRKWTKMINIIGRHAAMRRQKTIYQSLLLLIATTMSLLTACRKEELYEGPRTVSIKAYMQQHIELTRAYLPLDDATYPNFTAGAFVTMGEKQSATTMTWDGTALETSLHLEEGDYWLYTYMPWNEKTALHGRYITIPGIEGLSSTDVLVAKAARIVVNQTDEEVRVPIYMDHLMAKITPHFYLDERYAEQRSIELTKVELLLPGCSHHVASITFSASDGTYSVSWSANQAPYDAVVASEPTTVPAMLPTQKADAVPFGGCYVCPNQPIDDIALRVTYNVYDTAGELTRENVTAENSIIRLGGNLEAGKNYNLYIKIVPSYLYVLSDNDMESSFVIL